MGQRLELHTLLQGVLGSTNVYFQPPSDLAMNYPCVVYSQDNAKTEFAGNKPYSYAKRYQVTVIDRKADSLIPDKIAMLPLSNFERAFTANNLHHHVFNLYF